MILSEILIAPMHAPQVSIVDLL